MFSCNECGYKLHTAAAAVVALHHGCPSCGGCDIEIAPDPVPMPQAPVRHCRHCGATYTSLNCPECAREAVHS